MYRYRFLQRIEWIQILTGYKFMVTLKVLFQAYISEPYYTNIIRDRKMTTIQMIGNAGGLVGKCIG
jgi:hypothetical protein